jgi:predicted DNA-binding transcriptional regulator AlpA
MDGYLTRRELANTLGRDVATIDRWRKAGAGPPATLVGRAVVYSESSFRTWLAAQEEGKPAPRQVFSPGFGPVLPS